MKKIATTIFIICVCGILVNAQQKKSFDLKASVLRGVDIYQAHCITCHMESGEGLENVYPPLAKSDYLMADKKRTLTQVLYGLSGPIKVKGVQYDSEMLAIDLNDEELSDVVNYIRNTWGNKGEAVKPEDAKAVRK